MFSITRMPAQSLRHDGNKTIFAKTGNALGKHAEVSLNTGH